jgi:ribonuclease P protein component
MLAGRIRPESWRPHERLRKRKDFERVYEAHEAYRAASVVLFCYRQEDLTRKAAFVASKKVGKAVARNRARRLMREAFRRLKKSVLPQGVHLVFVARGDCAGQTYQEIRHQMTNLLERAGLLIEPID